MADLGSVLIGLLGIAWGAKTLAGGAQRLAEGMQPRPGARVPPGVRIATGARVPTMIVPRSVTAKVPPIVKQTAKMKTLAGPMATSMYGVQNLNDRLAVIIDKAHQGKTDPQVVAWARKQVAQRKLGSSEWNGGQWVCPEKDAKCELQMIHQGMRRSIRYTSDPVSADLYARPARTLAMGAGDCDEYTAVACAAAMAVGRQCRMIVIETTDSKEGANHIYAEAMADGKWIPMDASVNMPFGWSAPDSMVRRRWIYEV